MSVRDVEEDVLSSRRDLIQNVVADALELELVSFLELADAGLTDSRRLEII